MLAGNPPFGTADGDMLSLHELFSRESALKYDSDNYHAVATAICTRAQNFLVASRLVHAAGGAETHRKELLAEGIEVAQSWRQLTSDEYLYDRSKLLLSFRETLVQMLEAEILATGSANQISLPRVWREVLEADKENGIPPLWAEGRQFR